MSGGKKGFDLEEAFPDLPPVLKDPDWKGYEGYPVDNFVPCEVTAHLQEVQGGMRYRLSVWCVVHGELDYLITDEQQVGEMWLNATAKEHKAIAEARERAHQIIEGETPPI